MRIDSGSWILLLAVVAVGMGVRAEAAATFLVSERTSRITFDGANLGTDTSPIPPDVVVESTDLAAPFHETVAGSVDSHIQIGTGSDNSGSWNGIQSTVIASNYISSQMSSASTTGFEQGPNGPGSPLVNVNNRLEVKFQVSEETSYNLAGSFSGSTFPLTEDDFVRVRLRRIFTLFDSFIGHELPSMGMFSPGQTYILDITSSASAFGQQEESSSLNVALLLPGAILLGDANNDGQVTGLDLIAVQQNFGTTEPGVPPAAPTGLHPGDANDDGLVSGLDLIAVQQNFGKSLAPVPEPAAMAPLALALFAGCRARR